MRPRGASAGPRSEPSLICRNGVGNSMSEPQPREKKIGFFKKLFRAGAAEEPQREETADTSAVSTPDAASAVSAPDAASAVSTPDAASAASGPSAPVAPFTPDAPSAVRAAPAPAPVAAPAPEVAKEGFFARLKKQLSKTKTSLVEKVREVISFHGKVNEELLEEIRS